MPSRCCGSWAFSRCVPFRSGWLPRHAQAGSSSTAGAGLAADQPSECPAALAARAGGCFSHLRQITDRHWLDLLDRRGAGCGVLLAGETVLAGCVQLNDGGQAGQLELMRDVAWDPRLDQALPAVLRRIQLSRRCPSLVTALDDAPMAELLLGQGWRRERSNCSSVAAFGVVRQPPATCSSAARWIGCSAACVPRVRRCPPRALVAAEPRCLWPVPCSVWMWGAAGSAWPAATPWASR